MGLQREREAADLVPHASKFRAAEHPGAHQIVHQETQYTESVSLVPLEGQAVKAMRQSSGDRVPGVQVWVDQAKGTSEERSARGTSSVGSRRQYWIFTGWV